MRLPMGSLLYSEAFVGSLATRWAHRAKPLTCRGGIGLRTDECLSQPIRKLQFETFERRETL